MIASGGKLTVLIGARDGEVTATVLPPKPVDIGTILTGKSAEECARIVPLIFNICAAAQESAVRSALDLPVEGDLCDRVQLETLREHVLKLMMIWPELMGERPDRVAVGKAATALRQPAAAGELRQALIGSAENIEGWAAFEAWMLLGETVVARTFANVYNDWDVAWGRTDVGLFDKALAVDWDSATQSDVPVENCPACRLQDSALLQDVEDHVGRGTLWRMTARLEEALKLLNGATGVDEQSRGIAEAARGAMLVRGTCGDTGLSSFERLSPTDFALAEGGVLTKALQTLPASDDETLVNRATMIVETVDPCVPSQVEIRHA